MKLDEALRVIAQTGGLDADALISYAQEDTIGGRDTLTPDGRPSWDAMSTFFDEGRVVYALVRALKPRLVLEIGVASGGTSTHILSALERNGGGSLNSIDIEANCGINVPAHLRNRWNFTVGDALTIDLPPADFVFEDGAHTLDFTTAILKRLKELAPRAIVSHDYYTHETYGGFAVKQAWDAELQGGLGVKIDGAFTGLGVWFNAEWQAPIVPAPSEMKEKPTDTSWGTIEAAPAQKAPAKRKAARK